MSQIINYGTLLTSLEKWLNRDDLTDQLPQFVGLMERRLYRTLRCPANEVEFDYVLTEATDTFVIPPRYLEAKSFSYNGYALERISYWDYQQRLEPNGGAVIQGTPRFFCRQENQFKIWPAPAGGLTAQIIFYADLSGLGDLTGSRLGSDDPVTTDPALDTNNVLLLCPDLYLFGSLIYADAYLAARPDDLMKWRGMYEAAYAELMNFGKIEEFSGSIISPTFFSGGYQK